MFRYPAIPSRSLLPASRARFGRAALKPKSYRASPLTPIEEVPTIRASQPGRPQLARRGSKSAETLHTYRSSERRDHKGLAGCFVPIRVQRSSPSLVFPDYVSRI